MWSNLLNMTSSETAMWLKAKFFHHGAWSPIDGRTQIIISILALGFGG